MARGRRKGPPRAEVLSSTITEHEFSTAFTNIVGFPPRRADWEVQQILGGTVEAAAEYVWDHWLGKYLATTGLNKVESAFFRVVAQIREEEEKSATRDKENARPNR